MPDCLPIYHWTQRPAAKFFLSYIMVEYADFPQTAEYTITTLDCHRDYKVQIPIRPPNKTHKVHELTQQAVLHLYTETHVYNDLPGIYVDRIDIMTMSSDIFGDFDDITYFECSDRMIRPGSAYLLRIKQADGSFRTRGEYGDTDDEGSLPTPMAPHKLMDYENANYPRERQRT